MADDLTKKIVKQIEYYFSDKNYPRDKFLQTKVAEDPERWVNIDILTTFNRLKSLTTDVAAIAKAMREAGTGLVEVSEDSLKLRRNPDKPILDRAELDKLSAYIKGFKPETTIDEVINYCESKGFEVEAVTLRKFPTGEYRGSAFVQFKSVADMEKFVAIEDHQMGDTKLQVEAKPAYHERKRLENEERKKNKKAKKQAAAEGEGGDNDAANEEAEPEVSVDFTPGCVVTVTGLGEGVQREDIKEALAKYGEVQWIDYSRNEEKATVRFSEPDPASKAVAESPELKINDFDAKLGLLTGDEEREYYVETERIKNERRRHKQQARHTRRGRFGGGQGGGKRRGGDRESPSKRAKHNNDE